MRTATDLMLRNKDDTGVLLALRLQLLMNNAEVALGITVIAGHDRATLACCFI
jgi:hypothetical protein